MKYFSNALIIKEYREIFRKYGQHGIIDMDDYLKHPFSFQLHRLEDVVPAWEGKVPAYRQSQFLIAFIQKGTGEKTIGHFSFPIGKNTLFVVPPGVPHASQYRSLDCRGFTLSFDMAFFVQHYFPKNLVASKRIFKKSARPFVTLTSDQAEEMTTQFESLLREYLEQWPDKDEMIAIKVLELLVRCDRCFTLAESLHYSCGYHEVIESFHELLQKHYSSERSVQFYANALHLHPNYLNSLIKRYSGMTAKQTIADHLFLEAKGLLASPSLTIKEISFTLGFTTPGSFSFFFKRLGNVSPSAFRRLLRGR
jgi:AraC family transcriptional activator of pobA